MYRNFLSACFCLRRLGGARRAGRCGGRARDASPDARRRERLVTGVVTGLVTGLVTGVAIGLAIGLLDGPLLTRRTGWSAPPPPPDGACAASAAPTAPAAPTASRPRPRCRPRTPPPPPPAPPAGSPRGAARPAAPPRPATGERGAHRRQYRHGGGGVPLGGGVVVVRPEQLPRVLRELRASRSPSDTVRPPCSTTPIVCAAASCREARRASQRSGCRTRSMVPRSGQVPTTTPRRPCAAAGPRPPDDGPSGWPASGG